MNAEDLKKFASADPDRQLFNSPWSADNYSYVTNGYLILRLPRLPDVAENPKAPGVSGIFITPKSEIYYPIREINLKGKETCKECEGQGVNFECPECNGIGDVNFDSDYHNYIIECKSCDGTGKKKKCENCYGTGTVESKKAIKIGEVGFQNYYLLLLKTLPNCKIGPTGSSTPAWIIFDGGDGLIMPMRL